ncbi:hypothetical protein DHC50_07480 [Arenibacter sp. A80]|jgi:hypothetical protein|nr:hypothetical protein [Arenibacter sp. A80]RFT57436.1 hypothetical protein D0S24_07475 [Arenibacter sp. P308M17]
MNLPGYALKLDLKKMEQENSTSDKARIIADLDWNIKIWKTDLQFIEEEITFIERLLKSNAFNTNTPNLFERLQNYGSRIASLTSGCQEIKKDIYTFLRDLEFIGENTHSSVLVAENKRLDKLKAEVKECLVNFKHLKAEIFHYADGVLKMYSKVEK